MWIYLYVSCNKTGLEPLQQQIYCIWSSGQWSEVLVSELKADR